MGQSYNPQQVTARWRGINIKDGVVSGTFITATRNTKNKEMNEGGDDDYTLVHIPGRGGVITITYRSGAPILKVLNDLARDDERRNDGFVNAGDLYIEDFSGTTKCLGETAVLEGVVDYEAGTTEGEVAVNWLCRLDLETGGYADITARTTNT